MRADDAQFQATLAESDAQLPSGWTVRFHADESASPIREDVKYDRAGRVAHVTFNAALYDRASELQADIQDVLRSIAGHLDRHEL